LVVVEVGLAGPLASVDPEDLVVVDPVAVSDLVAVVALVDPADPVVVVSVVVVCDRPDLVGDQDHPDQGGAQDLPDLARLAQLPRNGFLRLLGPLAHRVLFLSGNGFGLCRAGAESREWHGKNAA
jgi:hypothetical protein